MTAAMLGSPRGAIYTLAPWEVRQLVLHYTLIGRDFEEVGLSAA
jgi:hypothetical protein